MEFDEAVARLEHLLTTLEWPPQIVWIRRDQVLHVPRQRTVVFRPEPDAEARERARTVFRRRYGSAPAISFYAAGHDGARTFAWVEAIEELGPGEDMFVHDGLKVAAQADVVPVDVTNSAFWWWLSRRVDRSVRHAIGAPQS